MKRWGTLLLSLGSCACIVAAVPLRAQFAASRAQVRDHTELNLFPSGRFLRELSLGHRHLVADIAWLAAIQYYGKHKQGDRRFGHTAHLFTIITDADPTFATAYLFGALILAETGRLEEGALMLRRGVERNPDSWYLRFEYGFYHYVYTRRYDEAGAAFTASAACPGAPGHPRRFAAASFEKAGDDETAKELWRIIAADSDNEEIQRMAAERIEKIAERESQSTL